MHARLTLARLLHESGAEPALVVHHVERALKDAGVWPGVYVIGSELLMGIGESRTAIRILQNAPDGVREQPIIIAHLGVALFYDGQYAAAETVLVEAVQLEANSAYANAWLGLTYRRLGQQEKAGPYLERAVELEPNHYWYQRHLGEYYRSTGDFDRAYPIFSQLHRAYPEDSFVNQVLEELEAAQ